MHIDESSIKTFLMANVTPEIDTICIYVYVIHFIEKSFKVFLAAITHIPILVKL